MYLFCINAPAGADRYSEHIFSWCENKCPVDIVIDAANSKIRFKIVILIFLRRKSNKGSILAKTTLTIMTKANAL